MDNIKYFNLKEKIVKIMKSIEYIILEKLEDGYKLNLLNSWDKQTIQIIIEKIKQSNISTDKNLIIDFKNLKELDSIAIIYLISFLEKFKKQNISYLNFEKYEQIFEFYQKHYQNEFLKDKKILNRFFESLGKKIYEILKATKLFIDFVGKVFYFIMYLAVNPKKIRVKATLKYIETSAVDALLIVAVTSFLVGVVIAYQGAVQLEKFGANIFVVEMISITMFREIAPLVTAIVIAGRSASSYTAEIGAMKITEEIDAMRTMNFEPIIFLTIPRIFALCVSLPLLVFFADIVGVMGGMVIAYTSLDITYVEFINRLQNEVPVKHLLLGVFKALFFGFFIAIIGCFRGFQVENNTTSIGKYTTMSVVNAIFVVILLDAVFSVIFTQMGI